MLVCLLERDVVPSSKILTLKIQRPLKTLFLAVTDSCFVLYFQDVHISRHLLQLFHFPNRHLRFCPWRSKDRTCPPNTTYRRALSKFLTCVSLGDDLRYLTSFVFDISKSDFMPVLENIISYCIVSLFTNLFFFFSLMNENYRRHIFEQRKRIRDLSSLFPRTVQLNTTTTRRSRAQLFGSSLTTKPMGANWVEKQPVKEKRSLPSTSKCG